MKKNKKVRTEPKKERKIQPKYHSAKDKCQAVLSIWAERRKPSEICHELGINWAVLNHWQNKALKAMMLALEPRNRKDGDKGPALGPKLETLLEKVEKREKKLSKLGQRLEKIQEGKGK